MPRSPRNHRINDQESVPPRLSDWNGGHGLQAPRQYLPRRPVPHWIKVKNWQTAFARVQDSLVEPSSHWYPQASRNDAELMDRRGIATFPARCRRRALRNIRFGDSGLRRWLNSINFTVHLTGVLRTVLSVELPPRSGTVRSGVCRLRKRMERLWHGARSQPRAPPERPRLHALARLKAPEILPSTFTDYCY